MRRQYDYRVIFTSPLGTHTLRVRASSEERAEQAGIDHLRIMARKQGQSGIAFSFKSIKMI
jgi:hypothetical protein